MSNPVTCYVADIAEKLGVSNANAQRIEAGMREYVRSLDSLVSDDFDYLMREVAKDLEIELQE